MMMTTRNLMGLLALSATLLGGLNGCSVVEPFRDDGCLGGRLIPEIKWKIRINPPGVRQADIDGDDFYAHRCAKIQWNDKNGKEVSTEIVELDGKGDGSLTVPEGAVEMEIVATKCPDETSSSQAALFRPVESHGTQTFASEGLPAARAPETSRYLVVRCPIEPSDHTLGHRSVSYTMNVLATSFEEASSKANAVVERGVGATVPADVQVLEFVEISHSRYSVDMRTSLPESLTQFELLVNHGAHSASLSSDINVSQSSVGSWSSCTTRIPLQAFETTFRAGESTLVNKCDLRFSGTSPATQDVFHVMESVMR